MQAAMKQAKETGNTSSNISQHPYVGKDSKTAHIPVPVPTIATAKNYHQLLDTG